MKLKSLPTLILVTLLCHVLAACGAGSGTPSAENQQAAIEGIAAQAKHDAPQVNRQEGEAGREVMVPDPETVMVPDQPETLVPSNIDLSTCETLYFVDASGNGVTFYRCFNSDYPVLSTKGICADTAGVKMDRCPNDSTPACRATASDAKVFFCEELGKQWCVNADSNAFQACPAL